MAFPLQFPLPNLHQASLGVGGVGGEVGHILNLQVPSNTCPPHGPFFVKTGEVVMCISLCALVVLMRAWFFCSYTHTRSLFI